MKFTTSLFGQILQVVPRARFARIVHGCGAERHSKGFSCWDQFVSMLFCQLAGSKSLREISDGKVHDTHAARLANFPKGSIVACDRAYCDYELFHKWTTEGVYFVTRQKGNAAYADQSSHIRRDDHRQDIPGPICRLVALLRLNLFSYRDLWKWLDDPFSIPPLEPAQQLELTF